MILRRISQVNRTLNQSMKCQQRCFTQGVVDWNLSIANSSLVQLCKSNLIELHELLHIPWWAEIALVTVACRALVTFPLTINQKKIFQRYQDLTPEIEAISKKLKVKIKEESFLLGRSKTRTATVYRRALTKEINRLIQRDNCHPIKAAMVPFFQIPLWFVLSHSYRNLARLYPNPEDAASIVAFKQLEQEGALWFNNLTVPDPTGILPIATAVMNLVNIQMHVNERKRNGVKDTTFVKFITNGGRLISLVIIPIGLMMPADMSLYWLISASMGVVQNVALQNSKVKQTLNIKT